MVAQDLRQPAAREYVLGDREFARICGLVKQITGINLGDAKRDLVYSRFSKRLRALGIASFAEYCDLVETGDIDESDEFVNAITTNLTSFFRESHHFDFLARTVVPDILARSARRFRVWSAGCSTGEEPYSIAMTILEHWTSLSGWDIRILATDLDSNVVDKASAGIYDARRVESLPKQTVKRWFRSVRDSGPDASVQVDEKLRSLLVFKRLNLMDAWPMNGPFQVIFCRNTIIYFDKDTQRTLFEKMAALQQPGDYLFIGHSETLAQVTDRYRLIGQTVYQKID